MRAHAGQGLRRAAQVLPKAWGFAWVLGPLVIGTTNSTSVSSYKYLEKVPLEVLFEASAAWWDELGRIPVRRPLRLSLYIQPSSPFNKDHTCHTGIVL